MPTTQILRTLPFLVMPAPRASPTLPADGKKDKAVQWLLFSPPQPVTARVWPSAGAGSVFPAPSSVTGTRTAGTAPMRRIAARVSVCPCPVPSCLLGLSWGRETYCSRGTPPYITPDAWRSAPHSTFLWWIGFSSVGRWTVLPKGRQWRWKTYIAWKIRLTVMGKVNTMTKGKVEYIVFHYVRLGSN